MCRLLSAVTPEILQSAGHVKDILDGVGFLEDEMGRFAFVTAALYRRKGIVCHQEFNGSNRH